MADLKVVKKIMEEIGVGQMVATELAILSGDDADLVIEASRMSTGLDHCKARIIDERFTRLEGYEDDGE